MSDEKMSVSIEQLTLSNSLQLTSIVELLEEKGILTQNNVLERMKDIRDRKNPS